MPHLVPYQGSKRRLAGRILAHLGPRRFATLIEPFAGSAALTLAAARLGVAPRFALGDSLAPLAGLWRLAIEAPDELAERYGRVWRGQAGDPRGHFERVRDAYNAGGDPAMLLYLLCRCVKSAPRFNAAGAFNQSADHRRAGARPDKIRARARAVSALLRGRATVRAADFRELCAEAGPRDLVYLDPPWAGTTRGHDKRYHAGLPTEELLAVLRQLDARGVPFALSYDGRTGGKRYGPELPADLSLRRVELPAGRSSQATLLGRRAETFESLYLSRALIPT